MEEAVGRVPEFGSPRIFSYPIISKLDKHVVLLHIQSGSMIKKSNLFFLRISRLCSLNTE